MNIGDRVKVKEGNDLEGNIIGFNDELGFLIRFDKEELHDAFYQRDEIEVITKSNKEMVTEKEEKFIHLMQTLDKLDDLKEYMNKDTYNCIKAKIYIKLDGGTIQ